MNSDPAQIAALEKLEALFHKVVAHKPPAVPGSGGGGFGSLAGRVASAFGLGRGHVEAGNDDDGPKVDAPKGLYIWGGVGCGKTFIMDMFYECVPGNNKRRVHFNSFMLEVHDRLHEKRKAGVRGDPLPIIARELVQEGWLLCFDEFQVTDVGDAMIMQRLFGAMFDAGLVVVATSNRPPDDLYKGGLQRELFLPFIDELKGKTDVHPLESDTDYRLTGTQADGTYYTPLGAEARAKLDHLFARLSKQEPVEATTLRVQGRAVHVPEAAVMARVARFSFTDLCEKPLGAGDYLVIARSFATVFLTGVPLLTLSERNEVRRLIVLIDTLYEHNVKLVMEAAAAPHLLFKPLGHSAASADAAKKEDPSGAMLLHEEVFAFDRTVSRLTEMQSEEYLSKAWDPTISAREKDAMASGAGGPADDAAAEQPAIDVSPDGIEFLRPLLEQSSSMTEAAMEHMWARYDVNGDGRLDMEEMRFLLEDLAELATGTRDVSSRDVQEFFALMGDTDGRVSRERFLEWVREHTISGFGSGAFSGE